VYAKSLRVLEYDKVLRRLAEQASFSGGRALALALQPSGDATEVRARLARTAEARRFLASRDAAGLGGAHDMREEIEGAARGRVLLPQELLDIAATIAVARRLRRALLRDDARWPALAEVAERLDPCQAVDDAIRGALDDAGEVRDNASPRLGALRRELRVAHDRVNRQLQGILRGPARQYLQEALITQRAGRWVVPVKADFRAQVPGVVHDASDSGATVFVEPLSVVELGNRHRELQIEEEHEVTRILRELSSFVADEAEALAQSTQALAELDLVLAIARYGETLNAVVPEVVDAPSPRLRYDRARHPLLDPETVVPIDVHVGEAFRILVITGPNTGGKTVTLKTVGLLTLMAQAGMAIPALDGARLAVFDGVWADIGDEQSIEQSLSTFSGHMTNIIQVVAEATPRALVLFDELGAGTDPSEGAALAVALLEWLRERGIATVASSHFTELKTYAWATDFVSNASVEFDVETLRPTYELTIGLPGRSNALAIAARLGLPAAIIERARAGLAVSQLEMDDMLREIHAARRAALADREVAAEARRAAAAWADRLDAGVRDIEDERARLLNEARRQAEGELAAAREAIQQLLRRAERAAARDATGPAPGREFAAADAGALEVIPSDPAGAGALRNVLEDAVTVGEILGRREVPATPAAPSVPLAPGARVRIAGVEREGELLAVHPTTAEVQFGALRMSVALRDVTAISASEAPPDRPVRTTGTVTLADAPGGSPTELDLRGERAEDAIEALERRLDRALRDGAPWVRVVHGHGTGALKRAVREHLRGHPAVARSRPGERDEGGDGVTVVYFD